MRQRCSVWQVLDFKLEDGAEPSQVRVVEAGSGGGDGGGSRVVGSDAGEACA